MKNETDKKVIEEVGRSTFFDLLDLSRDLSVQMKRNKSIVFPHKEPENSYGTYITCTQFKQDNTSHWISKPFTANGLITFKDGTIWDWTITREAGEIPHFQKFSIHGDKSPTKLPTSQTKTCSCTWSFLHSNNGCKCGAITPYNFNNLFR